MNDLEKELKAAKQRLLKKDEKAVLNIGSEQWLKVDNCLILKIFLNIERHDFVYFFVVFRVLD